MENMMACKLQTFKNVTPAVFADMISKAKDATGVAIAGNAGEATADKFTLSWTYDPASQVLEIQCLAHPAIDPDFAVQSRIAKMVGAG
jgi:hypothetical protein